MKKLINAVLSLGMAASLCACSSDKAVEEAGTYTAGTYSAESQGHSSSVKVTAEFDADSIKSVEIDASGETESIGVPAAETLKQEILDKQSADVDAVSGATETSDAVKRAMSDVIAQAAGTAAVSETTALKDGTYSMEAASFGVLGMMKGDVTITDGKIADIQITEETDSNSGMWFSVAEKTLIPRILEVQSLEVESVTGATTSSGAIKSIVSQAITAAGGNADEWHTPIEKKSDVVTKDGYDVIVVGLGGSGLMAYAAAAQSGASVFGIEAAAEIGGNSASVFGPMVIGSKNLDDKYNSGEMNVDADAVYNTWMEYVGSDEKADVIHRAVYESGEAVDYYMDNFDYSFDGAPFGGPSGFLGSFVVPEWTKLWTVYTADEDNTKWYALGPDHTYQFKNALEKAKGLNEKNDYQLELTADHLILDAEGNVTGVHAVSYDGTQVEITGKTVILATGGFLGNADMMKEVYGSSIRSIGCTVNKGAGIQMGEEAGGATYALATLPMVHISQVPNIIRDDSLTADQKAILSALAVTTDVMEVDETGAVYGNVNITGESNSDLHSGVVFAPGFHYYNVYSEEDLENIKANGLSEATAASGIFGLGQGGVLPAAGTPVEDLDTIVSVGLETKNVFKGTSSELAEQLGMDADTLAESLGDSEGTYYLFECAGYSYGTVGGLDVDANMNVLKEDGTVIENLYAVGQDSEGVCNVDGMPYTPWGGQAQSWTFVSGKIAGEAAAATAAK